VYQNGDYVLKDPEDGVNVFNVSKILGHQTVNIILIFFFFRCLPFQKNVYTIYIMLTYGCERLLCLYQLNQLSYCDGMSFNV